MLKELKKFIFFSSTQETEEQEVSTIDEVGHSAKVILFNDEWHTFDEVINQIIKATNCSIERAENLTLEVHERGKAVVYEGDMPDCLRVSSVLEEIELHTQIEF